MHHGLRLKKTLSDVLSGKMPVNKFIERYLSIWGAEKYADSFAVDYGYGAQLSTGLGKMRETTTFAGILGLDKNAFTDIMEASLEFAIYSLDPHPTNFQRANHARRLLEKHARDSNLSKEQQKEIALSIAHINKEIEKYTPASDDREYYGPLYKGYHDLLMKTLNGMGDIRDIASSAINANRR